MRHLLDQVKRAFSLWTLWILVAVSLHLAVIIVLFHCVIPNVHQRTPHTVSKYQIELRLPPNVENRHTPSPPKIVSAPEPRQDPIEDARSIASKPTPKKKVTKHDTSPPVHTEPKVEERTVETVGPALAESPPSPRSDDPEKTKTDLSGIDLQPSYTMLNELALADPRVKRRIKKEPGPFTTPNTPSRINIPKSLKYDEIQRRMSVQWTPDWSEVKDEGITKVSGKWIQRGLSGWLKRVQERIKKHDNHGGPAREKRPFELEPSDIESVSNEVTVEVALEPLRNGTWAVSISKGSGHPFFDKAAVRDIRHAAIHFPPWPEGYGRALIYRLSARFIIVPPSPSTLIGLTCAFPFCTPEELKNAEMIHWFKKLMRKNVRFLGVVQ